MDKRLLWAIGIGASICVIAACCAVAFGLLSTSDLWNGESMQFDPTVPVTEKAAQPGLPPATQAPTEPPIAFCPASMEAVIASVQYSVYNYEGEEWTDEEEPESFYLVTYDVNGDQISDPQYDEAPADFEALQNDTDSHLLAWDLFTQLIPAENRAVVSEYVVFSDGPSNVLAAVEQSYDDPNLWMVEVDNADLEDRLGLYFTLVHEFGHLLTLGPDQVPPDLDIYQDPENLDLYESKEAACPTYFPGGCSQPESYINAFYHRFWTHLVDEWTPIDELGYTDDLEGYYEELYTFYENHADEFVDDYAATNPSEDIAESFAYFVFSPKPSGDTLAEQKLLFFHEYPELVELRAEILAGFCGLTP